MSCHPGPCHTVQVNTHWRPKSEIHRRNTNILSMDFVLLKDGVPLCLFVSRVHNVCPPTRSKPSCGPRFRTPMTVARQPAYKPSLIQRRFLLKHSEHLSLDMMDQDVAKWTQIRLEDYGVGTSNQYKLWKRSVYPLEVSTTSRTPNSLYPSWLERTLWTSLR